MKEGNDNLSRKDFLKGLGLAGLGSALTLYGCKSEKSETDSDKKAALPEDSKKARYPKVPLRTLGKTGIKVPSLCHGFNYDVSDRQLLMHKGLKWGINYWDTAHFYAGGNSELGIGRFLKKNPEKRKDLFLVSKASRANSVADVEKRLQESLKRMNTDYIDLYYGVHGLSDPEDLTHELKGWAENAKKRKVIRHFGFSTHKNMAQCLMRASKLSWIDAIMTSYNFRLMQDTEMQDAIESCHKANIGLIAMKVMGLKIETDNDRKLTNYFLKKGYTEGQAKLKAVLEDKRISSACVTMNSVALITLNVAAVLDRKKLSRNDTIILEKYARETADCYCIGCSSICDQALPEMPFVSDIMRSLMYYNSYGDREKGRILFSEIPSGIRKSILKVDYTVAESKCPQKLPIGSLVADAVKMLS